MDEGDEDPPPRLFTPLYWAALAFGLAMILAGGAVGLFGARWFARPPVVVHPGARFDSAPGAWQGAARLVKSPLARNPI